MSRKILILLLLMTIAYSIDTGKWDYVFSDVAYFITSNASTWRLQSSVSDVNGYWADQWDYTNQVWISVGGGCTNLAQDGTSVYDTNTQMQIWMRPDTVGPGNSWTQLSINGVDIKISSNNNIYYASSTSTTGGYTVIQYNSATNVNTLIPGAGAVKVAPTPDGNLWIINSSGGIQRYDGTTWTTIAGAASEIVVGADGLPVILTQTTSTYGGYTVQKWNSTTSSWTTLDGIGGVSLAVDEFSTPYVVTSSYDLYRLKGAMSYLCPTCHLDCASCSDATTCQRCNTTLCMSLDQCIPCADGTHPSQSTSSCRACPDTCMTCTNATTCLTCQSGYGLQNGQCVVCPSGTYLSSGSCASCPGVCATCTDSTTCQTCSAGNGMYNGQCQTCPSATYLSSGSCVGCPGVCATCTDSTTCQTCSAGNGMYNGQCQTCPSATYLNSGICQPCSSTCATCTSSSVCQTCNANYGLYSSQCVTCPSGTYLSSGSCVGCTNNCATCTDSTTCLTCVSNYRLVSSQCVVCPAGSYPTSTSCSTCPSTCATCTSSSTCQTCQSGYGLINSQCVACPSGTYLSAGSCVACTTSCATCTDSSVCLTCSNGYYLSATTCIGCAVNCAQCTDAMTCQQCHSGYQLSAGQCSPSTSTSTSTSEADINPAGVVGVIIGAVACTGLLTSCMVLQWFMGRRLRRKRATKISDVNSPAPRLENVKVTQ